MVLSFLLFRFFDILKPWPIYIVDKLRTSLSILLDDVIAGIFSINYYIYLFIGGFKKIPFKIYELAVRL